MNNVGNDLYNLATRLFPLCRSITGANVRETLKIIKNDLPALTIHEVASGTQVFDWTVPKEWNIRDAWIAFEDGTRFAEFQKSNLHVVGYSVPVDRVVELEELQNYLYSLPEQPDWIPYVTSYYCERYGFCLAHREREALKPGKYHIVIDSTLEDGFLTYGELVLPGATTEEIFFSTYICHPSMANNELSGPCLAVGLAKYLQTLDRRYTYRFVFIPETIGSIVYLSRNIQLLRQNVVAGYNLTCVGDNRAYSYLPTRHGDTLADRAAKSVLNAMHPEYISYSFLDRGSDERQYNAPGVDLPVCSVMRTKYGEYPEYHTSADDLSLISAEGLQGSFDVYSHIINALENNRMFQATFLCEPQLGKRGLYPTISYKGSADLVKGMMDFLAYADGTMDLFTISNKIHRTILEVIPISQQLLDSGLIKVI